MNMISASKNFKRFLVYAVTVCLLVKVLSYMTSVTRYHLGSDYFDEFFAEEENYDVLFLGTSHMMDGVLPMELWDDYGIASYNLGYHGCMLPLTYWVMEMALEYTEPSLIVIDCANAEYPYKIGEYLSYARLVLSNFPFSLTKIRAVLDLLDDDQLEQDAAENPDLESGDMVSLLWDFAVYHSRWNDIENVDFLRDVTSTKGAELNNRVIGQDYSPLDTVGASDDEIYEADAVGFQYLERMLEKCREEGIEVLLINIPIDASEEDFRISNRIKAIADEYDVNYIDFVELDVVDLATDGADYSHLNPSGARKVTGYLGQYITKHYDTEDRRSDPTYAGWQDDYEAYLADKVADLRDVIELDVYLMLIADDDYDVQLQISEKRFYDSDYYGLFMENLGIDLQQAVDAAEIRIESGDTITYSDACTEIDYDLYITVSDRETGELLDSSGWDLLLDLEGEEQSVQAEGIHEQISF